MPPPSLQRAWRMKRWMRRLSGLTLNPLTQSRGVDAWISSLQDIRASHSPLPEPNVRKKTRATSGRSYGKSSAPSNPGSVSSKTSHIIYDWGLNKSMMTYDQWVSALRRVCLQRKKLVRRISESASSSWPTVRVSSANGVSHNEIRQGNPKKRLENTAVMWPTITATDSAVSSARPPEKMIRKDGRNVLRTPSLAETVMQPDGFPYTKQDLQARKAGKDYRTARVQWPTPRAQEPGSTSATHGSGLAETARHWLTPRATESGENQESFLKRMGDRTDKAHSSLTAQIKAWPTPVARDWKDSPGMNERPNGQVSLPKMAFQSGHQHREDMSNGDMSQMRLNPLFTEWLMGWPIGWTDFAPVETAWCHWWQRMHSELFTLLVMNDHGQSEY